MTKAQLLAKYRRELNNLFAQHERAVDAYDNVGMMIHPDPRVQDNIAREIRSMEDEMIRLQEIIDRLR